MAQTGGAVAAIATATGQTLTPWIRIGLDSRVTLISTVSDMGQGSRTGQIQILADELDVAWEMVSVEMAQDAEPYLDEGELLTGGSRSVRIRYDVLRRAGAAARAQLVEAAAHRWGVLAADCQASLGVVRHDPSRRRLSYGELAAEAADIPPPVDPPLKPNGSRIYIGNSMSMLGLEDKVCGRARYGIDVRLSKMKWASLRQSPVFGGLLLGVDEAPARAVEGVRSVVRLPGAVAVVADSTWAAIKGVRALRPSWSNPASLFNTTDIAGRLRAAYDAPAAESSPKKGGAALKASLRQAFAAAPRKVEATYELPLLSHCALEPMNATAWVTPSKIEVWAPTQAQTAARQDIAKALNRPVSDVVLHTTLLGGGFGRRLKTDYAVLAALVAREVEGPVQLIWTREEDITHDFYRPASLMTYRASLDAAGFPTGVEAIGATINDTAFGGSEPAPYSLGPFAATQTKVEANVPIGAWRSVDASITVFAKESFIDECAAAVGADPLDYRRRLLGDNHRALRVLDAVAEAIGWSGSRQPGLGRGLAMLEAWDTIVAHAIEVQVVNGELGIVRIVVAADCGTVVNPDLARAQFEGGSLMGLSAAIGEAITVSGGQVVQKNFDSYDILTMRQAPPVEVVLLETLGAKIGGAGEPPVPGVAPALANAIFAATGRRIRKLPLKSQGVIL
ncbi:MAG: molybdopterin cofactor-binding domain-containing protein [Caulobacteraceae bacterium]